MFRTKNKQGFTLIELLVALSILGLIVSLAMPPMTRWLDAREAALLRTNLTNEISLLPTKARLQGTKIKIEDLQGVLSVDGGKVEVITPIEILKNGFCKGGKFKYTVNEKVFIYTVHAPYCTVDIGDDVQA